MIQFRWRLAKTRSYAQDQGNGTATAVTEPMEPNAAKVDGEWCVLEYRLNFIPTVRPEFAEDVIVLKESRPVDNEWKTITVDRFDAGG